MPRSVSLYSQPLRRPILLPRLSPLRPALHATMSQRPLVQVLPPSIPPLRGVKNLSTCPTPSKVHLHIPQSSARVSRPTGHSVTKAGTLKGYRIPVHTPWLGNLRVIYNRLYRENGRGTQERVMRHHCLHQTLRRLRDR